MNLPFFYLDCLNKKTENFVLSEETSKHIIQVLRMKLGEKLQLTDGNGSLLTAEIIDDHKKRCAVKKTAYQFIDYPSKEISIAISLIKNNGRFEWFLEKATEIGVKNIYPTLCDRTEKQQFKHERMNSILISAMLQSKQVWLPVLHEPIAYQQLLNNASQKNKYIAHCEEDTEKNKIETHSNQNSCLMLIGPEGDFTIDEIVLAKDKNFKPVTLGNNRLRTETAGIVALTLLNQ